MKNYMKKIIVGIFSFVLLFVAQNAFAANWNSDPADCQNTVAIANYTSNTGYGSCWTSTSMSAEPGDTINVRIYYHNTSNVVAKNTRLVITKSSSTSTSHNFMGRIMSDNGDLSGNVNLSVSSAQSISFVDARWFPDQSRTQVSLPNGQAASSILSSGILIGDIAPGGSSQGTMVAVFKVSNNIPQPANNCAISNFSANRSSILVGESSVLSWATSDCTSVTIYPSIGAANLSGSQTVTPSASTTYTLTATGSNGVPQTRTTTVNVTQNPVSTCSINSFTASPTSITSGGSSVLNWSIDGCLSAVISQSVGSVNIYGGSKQVWPTQTTTYILTAIGSTGGEQTRAVTIYVNQISNNCSINSFTASQTSITKGGSSVLNWNTSDCTSVIISNLGYSVPVSGSQQVWPTNTTTYTLTATGSNGGVQTRSVTVSVDNNNNSVCRIVNFDASDTSIEDGDNTRLSWSTENCDHVSISGVASGLSRSGSYNVTPSYTRTYILNASGDNGSDSDSVKIYVDENNNNNNYNNCSISSFSASNTYVNAGGNTRLNWNTSNCNSVSISNLGNVNQSGNQTVYPTNSTNYVLTAYGSNGGIQTRSVYVTVNSYVQPPTVVNTCAVTTVATNITQTGAQLNGLITGGNGANTFFEYGTTVTMGQRTVSRYSNGGVNFSDFATGLSPNTIYFFRLNSDCQNGMSQGSIEIFKTTGVPVVGQTKTIYIQQGTTVVGTTSPVMLNISNRYELISAGDLVDYVVTYKNISKTRLTKPMIQVVLPTNITMVNASRGTYSVDTHTLSAQIEDLNPGQEGVIYLQGKVDSIPLNNSKIATTAILVYTTPSGSQENAMAYVINIPKIMAVEVGNDTGSVLGGSAFFGGFLSIGLIGWLIIILIILLLILIVRSAYRKNNVDVVNHTPTH